MSVATLAWRQFRFERRLFWRNPSAAFFNFLLPIVFLLLTATVFLSSYPEGLEVLVPGIAGMGVMTTTFTALAHNVTFLREQGVLKRMRGTPMPVGAYLGGLLGSAVVNAVIQVGIVVVLGHVLYGITWPRDLVALAVFTVLGIVAFGGLGVAFSLLIPNVDAAPAYVNAVFLPLIFVSGVFVPTEGLPSALRLVGEALPLKHVIDGLAGAIVHGEGLADHGTAVAMLVAWGAVGLIASVRRFRWE